jgi:hypothetical protein
MIETIQIIFVLNFQANDQKFIVVNGIINSYSKVRHIVKQVDMAGTRYVS